MDIEKVPRDSKKALVEARKNTRFEEADLNDQKDPAHILFYRDLKHDIFRMEKRVLFPPRTLEVRFSELRNARVAEY